MDLLTEVLGQSEQSELTEAHRIEWRHRKLERFLSRGSFLFVISDFIGDNDTLKSAMHHEAFTWYSIPVIVQDALEYSFPIFPKHGAVVPLNHRILAEFLEDSKIRCLELHRHDWLRVIRAYFCWDMIIKK